MGDAFIAHFEYFPGLGAGRDDQFFLSVQGGYFYFSAQCCLGDIDVQVKQDIIFSAAEKFVRFDFDLNIEIPARAAIRAGLPFAGIAGSVYHYPHQQEQGWFLLDVFRSYPRPLQFEHLCVITWPAPRHSGQVPTCTMDPRNVCRTWRTSPRPLQVLQVSGLGAGFCAAAAAAFAYFIAGDFYFSVHAGCGFLEFKSDGSNTGLRRGGAHFGAGVSGKTAKRRQKTVQKYQMDQLLFQSGIPPALRKPFMPIAVIYGPFFLI